MGGRAAIYARFSSHNQRGESIEIQVEKSRAYCAENDLRVVATYCDFAQTGTNTDRAEFQRMMADAKRGLFDSVVIYKVTRIMRNRDEMAMARIMLRRCRVEMLYAGEDISDGSAGVLQLGMLEVLAEYVSALDGERIRDGIQKNAERCMANGCVRYGWDIVDGRYVVNEEEAAAIRQGVPVAVFSLEMSKEQLMQRMLAVWGKVDMSKLRRPALLTDADWSNLYAAADVISRAPTYIDDTPALTTLELRARARRLKAEKGLGLVIVDYLQLMRTSRRTDSRELEISDISRSLKGLAKEMNVPVVALSQLN